MRSWTESIDLLQTTLKSHSAKVSRHSVSTAETEEWSLIQNILQGEFKKFDTLMDRYQDMVYYYALQQLKTPEEAEDFTQEVFLKTFEKLSQFRGDAKFSTWVFQIARNQMTKTLRKSSDIAVGDSLELEKIAHPTKPRSTHIHQDRFATWDFLSKDDISLKLRSLLDKLPQVYKKPLVLYYFENYSYPEIAQSLNIKLNTLKSHIFRGKELLKSWWHDEQP